jgi:hypothetical protein
MKAAANRVALTTSGNLEAEQGRERLRAVRNEIGDPIGARPQLAPVDQYSSANITVSTRVVTDGLAGSGDIRSMSKSW